MKLLEARNQARCELLHEEQCTNASQMYNCKQVLFRKRRLHEESQDDQREFRNLETQKELVKVLMAKVRNQYIEMADAFRKLFELFLSYQMDQIKIKQVETIHFKNVNITSEFVKKLTKETSHLYELEKKEDKAEEGH